MDRPIDNQLGPRTNLNYLYERMRAAYGKVLAAKPGDTKADESILVELEAMEDYMRSLTMSFMKKLLSDSAYAGQNREKLLEIKKILEEISRSMRVSIRKDHYMHRFAKHLRGVVKGKVRKTAAKGVQEFKKVQKEKKELTEKEKVAKEKMGKK